MKRHIPNFITSLNLVSGFFAIVLAFRGDISSASWLILAAMVFDFLDGFFARLLRSYSDLGKELDSLADVVSFGVAPAIIILNIPGISVNRDLLSILIISAMPVCAALRLAKFNIDPTQATGFKGLPTPANALAVISIVIAGQYSHAGIIKNLMDSATFLLIFTVVLSLLMVSRIPLLSLKTKNLGLRGNEGRYLLVVLVGISLILFGLAAAPLVIPVYIVVSIISPAIKL